jgi:hypothetical protein
MVVASSAPAVCPECLVSTHFINLTCYIPDWGATENDRLLYP